MIKPRASNAQMQELPLYDLKPYFCKLSEWERRLDRLEQKMACLSPQLVALSFELHEKGIQLLISKITKFQRVEEL